MPEFKLRSPIPVLKLEPPLCPIYMGCHGGTGHYFFTVGMRSLEHDWRSANHKSLCQLDTGFAPQDTYEQGKAWYFNLQAGDLQYNLISFWDNSIDSRPGSHSTFLLPGPPKSFDDALAEAKQLFPEVFTRSRFPSVTLLRHMTS